MRACLFFGLASVIIMCVCVCVDNKCYVLYIVTHTHTHTFFFYKILKHTHTYIKCVESEISAYVGYAVMLLITFVGAGLGVKYLNNQRDIKKAELIAMSNKTMQDLHQANGELSHQLTLATKELSEWRAGNLEPQYEEGASPQSSGLGDLLKNIDGVPPWMAEVANHPFAEKLIMQYADKHPEMVEKFLGSLTGKNPPSQPSMGAGPPAYTGV